MGFLKSMSPVLQSSSNSEKYSFLMTITVIISQELTSNLLVDQRVLQVSLRRPAGPIPGGIRIKFALLAAT